MFDDTTQMVDLTRRAFTDESWRASIVAAGGERVRAAHRYADRARKVLDDVRATLAALGAG